METLTTERCLVSFLLPMILSGSASSRPSCHLLLTRELGNLNILPRIKNPFQNLLSLLILHVCLTWKPQKLLQRLVQLSSKKYQSRAGEMSLWKRAHAVPAETWDTDGSIKVRWLRCSQLCGLCTYPSPPHTHEYINKHIHKHTYAHWKT